MPITMTRQQLSDLYRQSRGFGENALSMLTGGIAEPVAGFASLAALARGENAMGARDAVRDAFTYSPRTIEGQGQQRMLGELAQSAMNSAPVRTWQRGVDFAGRASPVAGATLQTVPTALGALTGYKQAMQTGNAVSRRLAQAQRVAMDNAMQPRVLHPQRGAIMFRGGTPKGEVVTWYASDKSLADNYARYRGVGAHEADVNAVRPFDAGRTTNEITPREFAIRALSQAGYNDKSAINLIKKFSDDFGPEKVKVTDFWSDPKSAARTRDFLRQAGFDSINIDEDGVMTTAVFNNNDSP